MEVSTTLLCAVIALVSVLLYIIQSRMNYWKKRGIPHDQPALFFGNMQGVARTRHQSDAIRDVYKKYKGTGPFCGFYFYLNPAVLALDLDFLKKVFIKDFNNFVDRGSFHNERDDPLSAHLFSMDGESWRRLRNKLSPTFSSGKMKFMFPTVVEVGHRFVEVLKEQVDRASVVEIKELNARFTTDVIGSCVFGLECNALRDPNTEFRFYGNKAINERNHHPIVLSFIFSCPDLARKLRIKITLSDVEQFFMGLVRKTVEYREKNNVKRNDFMSILIDLKNNKSLKNDKGEQMSNLTMEEIAAQSFLFYLAGFETSSSTLSYALYELARNPDIQERLRAEVNDVLAKHNGEVTYEGIIEMQYMTQVIEETLRMYSFLPILQRVAKEDYYMDDPKYKIEKGSMIIIPVEAIHYDPEIYPNPMQFDPERFTPEEKSKRESCAWLAFGDGPRNCIGLRFGKMQTKIGLALMIKNFRFSVCERTQIPLKLDIEKPFLHVDGVYLKLERV